MHDEWDARVAAIWDDATLGPEAVIARIDALAAVLDPADPRGPFERGGARDSAGMEAEAERLYRAALAGGLDDERRPQAVIQLASTLRNLGRTDEAIDLLQRERDRVPASPLRDEASAFLALALASRGEHQQALAIALTALAPHLSRYTRSVTAYAAAGQTSPDMPTANTAGSPVGDR